MIEDALKNGVVIIFDVIMQRRLQFSGETEARLVDNVANAARSH